MISNPPGAWRFFYSVTCQLHAPSTVLKGFCSVLGLFRVAQLHASYMSYAQVTTSNSQITT